MTTQRTTQQRNRAGGGMIAVLIVIFVGSALVAGMSNLSSQRAHMARRLADEVRAESIAEAGIGNAYGALSADFNVRTNADAFPPTDFDGGTYDVTVTPIGDDGAVIQSVGRRGAATVTIKVDTRLHQLTSDDEPTAYGYAMLADETITWTGGGDFQGRGSMHANDVFKMTGGGSLQADVSSVIEASFRGNADVTGIVTAPSIDTRGNVSISTSLVESVADVAIPDIDLTPYYNEALAHNQVYNGNQTVNDAFAPAGGIMWVDGDLHISGSGALTGCFIATGDLKVSGSITHAKVNQYPGFVSRDGDIHLTGGGTRQGLVFARIGDVTISGGGSVEGAVIAGGSIRKTGGSVVIAYVDPVPVAPNEVRSDGILVVSAWHE